ncbi:glycoside hydrolase family 32 protein [Micromonospora sp. DT81.3]|uniref:glycoside hydrolase family 32 protein n=1 Tax=Micromonospora sp. DT81.3 TaxID=3416523 RepID=UPI003CF4B203
MGILLLLLLAACVGEDPEPTPTASSDSPAPAPDAAYRPALHLTPDEHWMNDPQRPFFAGGEWHLYYLYNSDYPEGNGTEWYHATSADLVSWQNQGVAIRKYENGLGDIQSGSAVVDVENTAGFGRGAIVALVTQQDQGVQRQSLFWSADNGYTFTEYDGNPVMDNPGSLHWRDPKVVWDDASRQWVMILAEGEKLGFYTSTNLTQWTYRSGIERHDLGLLECPDLFQMSIDGDPTRTTWVLGTSANGAAYGRATGYAYWTGDWDGETFTAAQEEPQWLDGGSDFYAAVTWDDSRLDVSERLAGRFALGWMNNWAYAGDLPTTSWQGGAQSLVRTLRLEERSDGTLTLHSTPPDTLDALEVQPRHDTNLTVDGQQSIEPTLQPKGHTFRLRITLDRNTFRSDELRILLGPPGESVTFGFDAVAEHIFIARGTDAAAATLPAVYTAIQTAPAPWSADGEVRLDVIVDGSTLEIFTNDGAQSLTSLIYPGSSALRVESVGGEAMVQELRIAELLLRQDE